MKTKFIAIGLLTDRIDVALCSGVRLLDGRRIRLSFDQDAANWPRDIHTAAAAIRSAIEELGGAGLPARVLYHGPSACSEFVTPRVQAASEARAAAVLACADSLACPLDVAATGAMVVQFDKTDAEGRAHVVVTADGDDAITALSELARDAGVRLLAATPLDAVTMASLSMEAAETTHDLAAILHIGEHRSFLVIAQKRKLRFARTIAVGLNDLVLSLMRPIRLPGAPAIELSGETARGIVHECGVPGRTQVVHEELRLMGSHIIPALQPVLQRFMVELRQSLRFALSPEERRELDMRLSGPGAQMPGFTQIVADELGLKVNIDGSSVPYDFRDPVSAGGELAKALSSKRALAELGLEPLSVTRRHRQRQLQRWLWAGAAASLGLIAFDASRADQRLREARIRADAVDAQAEGAEALQATSDKLTSAANAMNSLEALIRKECGASVRMGGLLQELSLITPMSIRLFDITCKPAGAGVIGSVSGYAVHEPESDADSSRMLESYMQRLTASPLLARLALANVQSTTVADQPAQSFDMSFEAICAPRHAHENMSVAGAPAKIASTP